MYTHTHSHTHTYTHTYTNLYNADYIEDLPAFLWPKATPIPGLYTEKSKLVCIHTNLIKYTHVRYI